MLKNLIMESIVIVMQMKGQAGIEMLGWHKSFETLESIAGKQETIESIKG